MELLQLRYFLVAAKYQHMTKAAEVLQIAQPALSQSIKRLEQELGVSLFEREKRNIRLNDAGRFLEQKLLPIMAALDEIPSEIQKKERMNQRTIHLNLLAATRLKLLHSRKHLDERGFSCSVLSHQCMDLSLFQGKIYVLESLHARKRFINVSHF